MARRPREVSASGFYHVFARGAGGLAFFDDEDDHAAQYSFYARAVERHAWTVHAHCLMHTHHHVLVEVPTHEALVRGMHLLGTCQAMRLNSRRDRFGHVTAGRFGSAALHAHDDVARVAIYIATNPVAAGLVDDPREYRWTSHRAMLGVEPGPPWLETEWLPRLFAPEPAHGRVAYARHVTERCANLIAARPAASAAAVQRRAIAILLAVSAALLGLAATRDAIRAPDSGLDGAARRFAGLHGLTAATSTVPRTSSTRYVLELPPAGGTVRGGAAQMYLAQALLPASRTTDPAAAALHVQVAPDGTVTVEPLR